MALSGRHGCTARDGILRAAGSKGRGRGVLRNRIKVRRTLVRTKGGWREDSPKSANSTRVVPMNARVAATLGDHLASHPNRSDPSALLWPGRHYAGGGEWRGGLDWGKRMDYESSTVDASARQPRRSVAQPFGSTTYATQRPACGQRWACRSRWSPQRSGTLERS